ncbi:MAG: ribbon-helix-helix protein, CopG family [Proteobacteria bacterium]|jgi:predicted transcriptional regulator|nr:ribbon-helix-helix protein, CopG family [Pseudomonadota bacterium]
MRTIIDIPNNLVESLDRIGAANNHSRAALIREAISDFLRTKSISKAEDAFGLWKHQKKDGLQYQNDLRKEWGDQ